jgi:hypothetical protein
VHGKFFIVGVDIKYLRFSNFLQDVVPAIFYWDISAFGIPGSNAFGENSTLDVCI